MKWLYVGLMNPGKEYLYTRHNAGSDALYAQIENVSFSAEKKIFSMAGSCSKESNQYYFIFPVTFMNLSGNAVAAAMKKYSVDIEHVVVFHDEIELPPGEVQYKKGGGHRGHNGLRDIIAKTGSPDFHRIRIGVGRPPANTNMSVADYVLSKGPASERPGKEKVKAVLDENQLNWQ
ncbi:MAG: aminoacyl-tRNA hydrolase [Leptospiraceae bacterium]|nr:aminoacyl-tRNA hydrolase [Leptospiraceae bacterium]